MWNNKLKAITLSYDDGILQDKRAIEILDKYHLKATFNLNSSLLGTKNELTGPVGAFRHDKVLPNEVKEIYKNHEVWVHTLTHPLLTELDEATIIFQVEEDRKTLEKLTGKKVIGMAYPCGGINHDKRVVDIIKNKTQIRFARTITSTHSYELQLDNLCEFNPTIYQNEEGVFEVIQRFLDMKTTKPQVLYIWGHTYEMDGGWISWERFEEMCKLLANHDDVFYGTNSEVFFEKNSIEK